jgi:hypothetical protein
MVVDEAQGLVQSSSVCTSLVVLCDTFSFGGFGLYDRCKAFGQSFVE